MGTNGAVPFPPGTNLSQRPYFIEAKETGTLYYTSLIQNLQNQSVINIALPIFSQEGANAFEGVVVATIYLPEMGEFLQSQVSPHLQSNIGLLDSRGTILYTHNEALLGQGIFGGEVQSLLPPSIRSTFNAFINNSLRGRAGVGEISYVGSSSTIAYQPILIPSANNQTTPQEFGVLYITAPDVLAASQAQQIDQLRLLTAAVVVGIAAVCVTVGAIILRWNRRLDIAVKQRTSGLVLANEQLRQKTDELASANMEIASQADVQRDLFNITADELRTPTQSILANAEPMHDALQPVIDTSGTISSQPSTSSGRPEPRRAGLRVHQRRAIQSRVLHLSKRPEASEAHPEHTQRREDREQDPPPRPRDRRHERKGQERDKGSPERDRVERPPLLRLQHRLRTGGPRAARERRQDQGIRDPIQPDQ